MKTLLGVFAVMVFVTTVGVFSASAQEEKCPDLATCFETFKAERNKPCGSREKAIEVGEYIGEKFKEDPDNAELVKRVAALAAKMKEEDRICKRNKLYNDSFNAKRWDEFLNVSREIMGDPATDKALLLDLLLTHVSTSFDRVVEKNDRYTNEALMNAKTAIQNMESGSVSKNAKWGVFAPFGSKDNAVSWMNYMIGYINYYNLGATMPAKKDEAIQYFYKATQIGEKKSDPLVFREIGVWYAEKATELFTDYTKIVEANNKMVNEEASGKLALARAYADRAIDALGRAQKLIGNDPKLKSKITEELTEFYKFRFNGKVEGMDKYVADMIAKPMPDPSSTVTPVAAEETSTTSADTTPATVPTKPVAVTPAAKPTTAATTKPVAKPTTAVTAKPTASSTPKKPVVKKKGTR
jgi:hypothetical protein